MSSLEGVGRLIGEIYPATHMFTISRGVFSKALALHDLAASFWPPLGGHPRHHGDRRVGAAQDRTNSHEPHASQEACNAA